MHEFLAGVSGTATSLVTLLLAVLIGIWLNNRGLDKLETKMDARFDKMDVKFDKLSEKLSSMFADQAVQEYRLQ